MRDFLLQNGFRIIIIAAVIDILSGLLNIFSGRILMLFTYSIEYSRILGDFISLVQIVATILYWLAMAAILVHLERIYFGKPDQQAGRTPE